MRFALLQAGHYGTPQGRVRFFVVAAADGHPLPDMPQPTHDFPDSRTLQIKLPVGGPSIKPIRTSNGTAPHSFITIDDAISDLPRFDWCDMILSEYYFSSPLIIFIGNTLNQVMNQRQLSERFGNGQGKCLPWNARPRPPTVGMKAQWNIIIRRRQHISWLLAPRIPRISNTLQSVFFPRRLNGPYTLDFFLRLIQTSIIPVLFLYL
jgi:hypothetical protein